MRISSTAIYDANVSLLGQQQTKMLHTQMQVASGRRILTPADDPVAAARALEMTQSDAVNTQYTANRNAAKYSASLSEGILQSVTSLLQDVRDVAIQAGGGAINNSQKQTLAVALQGRLDELVALANSKDGTGNYLFSGSQGGTQPFANSATGVQYQGDDLQRLIQVSSARQMSITDSGADVFMRIKDGNGTFTIHPAAANAGNGIANQGSVANPALLTGNNYQITFNVVAGVTTYNVTNTTTAAVVVAGAPYTSGQTINFDGMNMSISGAPANGDTFTVAPSTSQSLFKTISDLITALGNGATPSQFKNGLGAGINNIDQGLNNVLTVRASLGSRLRELDALQTTGDDLGLQYKQTLSQLQDLDYTKAISDLTQQQIGLQAAQKSFKATADLSLFNYM